VYEIKTKEKEYEIMARVAMVTRTMQTTEVNVLCLNIQTAEPFNKDLVLAGTFKDNKAMMKAVSAQVDNDAQKAVVITTSKVVETLYGMTEDEFIKNAKVLPPREK
jgi:predicted transcriptional regulator YheO